MKTIKSNPHCPTCGAECKVESMDGETHYFIPITKQLEGEVRSLTANRNILETIKQQNEKLLAEIAKESNEKDKQILELKEDVIRFADYSSWIFQFRNLPIEEKLQLFSKYKDSKKQG